MPTSQIARSAPTPRSTSRVMMTGLIGPDPPTRGLLVRFIALRLAQDLSYGILPKNLAYPNGRSSKDGTTFIACRPRFCTPPSRPLRNQKAHAEPANRRVDGDQGGRGDRRRGRRSLSYPLAFGIDSLIDLVSAGVLIW